ncbi:NAD-dependent histone deacetylase HST3 [Colletotrichum sp. SAR 10_86]|nr:NAD-dependent histone deacetylase HST3 [Colletotrichum sp. SAR 10_86]KAJ5000099.1 NAD-dependent histone deacetylase HST3 [Colletotrichum sp. SAR 10_66]
MPTTQVTPTEDVLLQGIADALFKARKVVVITGAGISTNSGIPDFRSENGLYSLIQAQFDAASRENVPASRRLSSSSASSCSDTTPAERPIKRQKISSEDSAICIPKEDLHTANTQETVGSDDERLCSAGEEAMNLMPSPPGTRSRAKKALEFTKHTLAFIITTPRLLLVTPFISTNDSIRPIPGGFFVDKPAIFQHSKQYGVFRNRRNTSIFQPGKGTAQY